MVLGDGSKASVRSAEVSGTATGAGRGFDKGKSPAAGLASIAEVGVELTQLRSGKVVPADSEEARAEREMLEALPKTGEPNLEADASTPPPQEGYEGPEVDDEVHRKWSDMGLSRRAWSKTPSPQTVPATLAST